ncbi:ribonuclease H-like domain-containing protein [Tanacetum coccineum]
MHYHPLRPLLLEVKTLAMLSNLNTWQCDHESDMYTPNGKPALKHQPWVDAMNVEMEAFYRNNTWELTELPKDRKAIGNVNNAFLYGDLNEDLYMALPPGKSDYNLFTKSCKYIVVALLVYVDDIIITGNSLVKIEKFKQFLKSKFMIKDLGKLKYFLGIGVLEIPGGVCLNQRKYCLELIDEFGFLASKPSYIHMQPNIALSSEPKDDDPLLENVTDYQKLIGKLIYLTTTRSDIAYIVSCLSQFMHSPLKSHLKTALKVIRYLKGSPGKGINVSKHSASGIGLKAYSDVGLDVLILEEAEYRALASVTSEVIWILKILKDLNSNNLLPVKVFCDNNSAIKIAANPIFHERTKYLEIDLHFVREQILAGVIKTKKIDNANHIADILTKGLDIKQQNIFVLNLGL